MRHFRLAPKQGALSLRLGCVLFMGIILAGCGEGGGQQAQRQAPPVPVDVKQATPHKVDIYAEYPARVQGKRDVQVLARIEGILLKRHYEEGQIVHKGDLLVTIDPKPFQATVNQRKAELASAQASLNQAQRTWNRVHQLYKVDAVSEAERDSALSDLETSRAAVQQAEANLDAAQIDLGYTRVEAPLTGVTSLEESEEGSLVSNGTHLTTITQLDPVDVLFSLPEDDALARRKALSAMGNDDPVTREATIILPGGEVYDRKGRVDFTQSTIDPDTGTVRLRAVVKNDNSGLMPGRFVRVRIRLETRDNAIVVPNIAISDGQQSTQVYVVGDDGKAHATQVELGPNVGDGRVVESGLSAGDRVIISGFGQVSDGAPVKVASNGANGDQSSGQGGQQGGQGASGDADNGQGG